MHVSTRLLVDPHQLGRLDAFGFGDDGSDGDAAVFARGAGGNGDYSVHNGEATIGNLSNSNPSHPSYNGYVKRDRSFRLEAQFLRTLACRAGTLGGVAVRAKAGTALTTDMDDDGGDGGSRSSIEVIAGAIPGGTGTSVPGHVLRRLEATATRLVENYALMNGKDRGLVCRALCQLWVSLSGPGQGDNLSRVVSRGSSGLGWPFEKCEPLELFGRSISIFTK